MLSIGFGFIRVVMGGLDVLGISILHNLTVYIYKNLWKGSKLDTDLLQKLLTIHKIGCVHSNPKIIVRRSVTPNFGGVRQKNNKILGQILQVIINLEDGQLPI